MDRRERGADFVDAFNAAFDGRQSELWTMLPCIVESFSASERTVSVQPTIEGRVHAKDGTTSWVEMPLCIHVPVMFYGNSSYVAECYPSKNDEGLIFFSSRCIDSWWQSGGTQTQADIRMHDLSDGFFYPTSMMSQPNLPSEEIEEGCFKIRSVDGTSSIKLTKSRITLDAANTIVSGNFTPANGITGSFTTLTGQTVTVVGGIITSIYGG